MSPEVLADEPGEGYAVHRSRAAVVRLDAALRALLSGCRSDGRRPILVTSADAWVSPQVVATMRLSGGAWVATHEAGPFDALTGRRLRSFADLVQPAGGTGAVHEAFGEASAMSGRAVLFEVLCHHRAEEGTRIGPVASGMVEDLGGAPLDRWGLDEPLTSAWTVRGLTTSFRAQMPSSEPHLQGAPDGSFVQTLVSRTRRGLLERSRGGVPHRHEDATASLAGRAGEAMARLMEHESVIAGFTSAAEVGDLAAGRLRRPGPTRPEQPLAIALGSRAVHDLHLDVTALRAELDVTVHGRARLPSVVIRFSAAEEPQQQLARFADGLDPERLRIALGLDEKALARMFGEVPEEPYF